MAFMAALPAITSLVGTGVGLAGQAGLFGGQQEDTGKNVRDFNNNMSANQIALGLNTFAQGQQQMNQYQDVFNEMLARWRQNSDTNQNAAQAATDRYTPVDQAQAQAILSDIGTYQPYKQASVNTGLNALGYLNNQIDLANQTSNAKRLATNDVEQALGQSMSLYRPMETEVMGQLRNTVLPAAQQSWQAAQDYFKTMKEGINPDTWANQANTDVASQFAQQRAAMGRNRAAMGVDPSSGVAQAADLDMAVNEALQGAGASTKARQAGILQNRQDYGTGLAALQGGAGNLANITNNVMGTVQRGPSSFGLPIFQQTANFNPGVAKSMMMDPASSLSAGQMMKGFQVNPETPPIQQYGLIAQQNMQNLYNAIGGSKLNQTSGGGDTSGASYGALAGYGLSGLTDKKNWSGLSGLGTGGGSGNFDWGKYTGGNWTQDSNWQNLNIPNAGNL